MTPFQRNAVSKIRHMGGTVVYGTDKRWTSKLHGTQVYVHSADRKTEGFIGWPTIQTLMEAGVMRQKGNEYVLNGDAS